MTPRRRPSTDPVTLRLDRWASILRNRPGRLSEDEEDDLSLLCTQAANEIQRLRGLIPRDRREPQDVEVSRHEVVAHLIADGHRVGEGVSCILRFGNDGADLAWWEVTDDLDIVVPDHSRFVTHLGFYRFEDQVLLFAQELPGPVGPERFYDWLREEAYK